MTDLGRDRYDLWLEHELRAAAPEARALFVDELAARVRAQRFRMRPSRARLGIALAFSALMIAALGVLGAPGYVAHAATAIAQTAGDAVTAGGGSSLSGPAGGGTTSSSGTDQYAVANGICHRTGNGRFQLIVVDANALDAHAAHGDIIPAPPWGCPPATPSGTRPAATFVSIGGPSTVNITRSASFLVQVEKVAGVYPRGTVSCFDNLRRVVDSVPVDANGAAGCSITFDSLGTHSVTAVFKTADVNKWASSAGNVLSINVVKAAAVVSITTSRTPAPFGAGVTFTAVVTGPAGLPAPTGAVRFFDDGRTMGGPASLGSAGTVTLTSDRLEAGSHTMRASYSGDGNYLDRDASLTQVVAAPPAAESSPALQTQPEPKPETPPASLTTSVPPATAGAVSVAPMGGNAAPTTVGWAAGTFGAAPAKVSATVAPPAKSGGVQFAAGSSVIQIDAVTDSGQQITTLDGVLDIAIPNAPPDVAPMYQRSSDPWVVIPRLPGTTLPAAQPDGWYLEGSTLHILTRHLTKFGLATALDVKWGTRRRVHLMWAQRIVVYGAPSVDAQATYTVRRGTKVFGTWTRTLPAGKGAPANLWLTGKRVVPGPYRLTIDIKAGPQHWRQTVAIRYLR